MATCRVFEQAIAINAGATTVERCITDQQLMHRWLNPALRCEPFAANWDTNLGGKSRFIVNTPLWAPTLISTVIERQPGLVVWGGLMDFLRGKIVGNVNQRSQAPT